MSNDKHKGVQRRKFALANLPREDSGRRKVVYGSRPMIVVKATPYRSTCRPAVDITKEVRQLEKAGKVKRRRSGSIGSAFGNHIRRTHFIAV
jgi:hypothetical protein